MPMSVVETQQLLEALKDEALAACASGAWRPSPADREHVVRQTVLLLQRVRKFYHPRDYWTVIIRYWDDPKRRGSLPTLIALASILDAIHDGTFRLEQGILRLVRTGEPVSVSQRFRILKRDGYRCTLCGARASDGPHVQLEVDHIIARANGGTNDDANLTTLCFACNRGKRTQTL